MEGTETRDIDEEKRQRRLRRKYFWREVRRRIRSVFTTPLVWLATWIVPALYVTYMWFVWKTSRVEDRGLSTLFDIREEYDGFVGILWHEEVISVAWAYRHFEGHTLTTRGDAGRVIRRMLEWCGFTVFQRTSKRRKVRARRRVVQAMIDHMNENAGEKVSYGITVDGSKGPPYRLKKGALHIARGTGRPIVMVRTWYKRCLRLRTWDRTVIPLPFNVIHQHGLGPFEVPADIDKTSVFDAFHREMEGRLIDLAIESHEAFDQEIPEVLLEAKREHDAKAGDE